jgi:hypothetical protein
MVIEYLYINAMTKTGQKVLLRACDNDELGMIAAHELMQKIILM